MLLWGFRPACDVYPTLDIVYSRLINGTEVLVVNGLGAKFAHNRSDMLLLLAQRGGSREMLTNGDMDMPSGNEARRQQNSQHREHRGIEFCNAWDRNGKDFASD